MKVLADEKPLPCELLFKHLNYFLNLINFVVVKVSEPKILMNNDTAK